MKLTILPANEDLGVMDDRCRAISEVASVNDGTYRSVQMLPFKYRAFILKAHTSIGKHNEHFLHHRRSGSHHRCCKLLGSACLNMDLEFQAFSD